MSAHGNEIERSRNAVAIDDDSMHHQYGRRIEADRSWTVYHVFTGVPARVGGHPLSGLNRADATNGMLFLNRRNLERRTDRVSRLFAAKVSEATECRT